MTFFGETEHFSGKNGTSRWSILVGKQKHNVQKASSRQTSQGRGNGGGWRGLCLNIYSFFILISEELRGTIIKD